MGYYSEQKLDKIINPRVQIRRELTWTTGSGKVYRISEMNDHHLLSCLHVLEKRTPDPEFLNQAPTYRAMVDQLVQRGQLDESYYSLNIQDRLNTKLV